MPENEVEATGHKVVEAATIHAEAVESARVTQMENTFDASLEKFFNKRTAEGRFIDIGRIPFICDDVANIRVSLNVQSNDLKWLRWFVMGIAGGIGALLIMFIINLAK